MPRCRAERRLPKQQPLSEVIVAATIGNVLEWFDFLVYGYFAVTIAEVFFPTGNPTVSLLITFGAFGLSYLVRPLGAIVVGTYTDRHGRKAGLTLSIALMMIGTILMVVTPGYATIGLAAPVIITLARLLQGFSVGGEFGSAVAFLVEHGSERKGFSASWQWASDRHHLDHRRAVRHRPDDAADARAAGRAGDGASPMSSGCWSARPGSTSASQMAETPEFLEAEKPHSVPIASCCARSPSACCWRSAPRSSRTARTTCCSTSRPTGMKTLHLPASTGFIATLVGGVVLAVFSLVAGHWSDKTARTRIMLWTAWLFLLTVVSGASG